MDKNGNSLELIVRVKRKRENESIDSLCIVESEQYAPASSSSSSNNKKSRLLSSVTNQFNNLQTSNESKNSRKLILKKIQTIDQSSSPSLSSLPSLPPPPPLPASLTSLSSLSSSSQNQHHHHHHLHHQKHHHHNNNNSNKSQLGQYIFTSSTKYVENSSNIFMVDLAHRSSFSTTSFHPQPSSLSSSLSSSPQKKEGVKILDPATRALHAAFNLHEPQQIIEQILLAIEQGANINTPRPSDGMTALMIAVQYSNIKLVSKLLQKGANVYLQNQDTKSAIDFAEYAEMENRNDSTKQILFLLRHAASNQYFSTLQSSTAVTSTPSSTSPALTTNDDYVYDIYSIERSHLINEEMNEMPSLSSEPIPDEQLSQQQQQQQQQQDDDSMEIPVVEVPGIKIINGDLSGEVTFCYDSDWSDLADDEDPDSNDEKFFGNDYPDEDWGNDDDGGGDGDGDDDDENDNRRGCYNENNGSDYNQSDDDGDNDSDDDLGQRKVRWNPNLGDGDDDEDDKMPKFDRKGIGRVLQPFIVHGPNGITSNERIDINELWNLRPDAHHHEDQEMADSGDYGGGEGGDGGIISHQTRKEDMARRTGMRIGSSEREFDRNGLPKYGMDLSDDDEKTNWIHSTFDTTTTSLEKRIYYNEEAYDSDLDKSSSSHY